MRKMKIYPKEYTINLVKRYMEIMDIAIQKSTMHLKIGEWEEVAENKKSS